MHLCTVMKTYYTVLNAFGVVYFVSAIVLGTVWEWFVVLPDLSRKLGFSVTVQRVFLLYIFVNAMGNYLLASSRSVHWKGRRKRSTATGANRYPMIPFRAHFCKVCQQFVLKRDRHCFILGKCIGYQNQKYFIYCALYTSIISIYTLVTMALFLHLSRKTEFPGILTVITLLPSSIMKWFYESSVTSQELLLVLFLYICASGILAGLGYFTWEIFIVTMGLTTHETLKGMRGTDTSIWENYEDVFGKYWFLGLFLPLPFPQYSNGLYEGIRKISKGRMD